MARGSKMPPIAVGEETIETLGNHRFPKNDLKFNRTIQRELEFSIVCSTRRPTQIGRKHHILRPMRTDGFPNFCSIR